MYTSYRQYRSMSTNSTDTNALIQSIPIHTNCTNMYACTRELIPISMNSTDTYAHIRFIILTPASRLIPVSTNTNCMYALILSIPIHTILLTFTQVPRQYILLGTNSTVSYALILSIPNTDSYKIALTCTQVPVKTYK